MATMSLNLSDDLARLADNFDQFAHGGVAMDGEAVLAVVKVLRSLCRDARELENEVSQKRWNEAARVDRMASRLERMREAKCVLAEIERPGSNVTLFPAIARSFGDGHPSGAA